MRSLEAEVLRPFAAVFLLLSLGLFPGSPHPDARADQGLSDKNGSAQTDKVTRADPVEEEPMTDIIDIRPPVSYGWDRRWIFPALSIAAILALLGVIYFLKRRSRKRDAFPGFLPPEPEDLVAMNRLRELSSEDALPDREFYFRLSGIARSYLDGRYGLDTMENTTEELLPVIRRLEADRERLAGLAELFRFSDPVKFASAPAGTARRETDLEFVRDFVHATRRVEGGEK